MTFVDGVNTTLNTGHCRTASRRENNIVGMTTMMTGPTAMSFKDNCQGDGKC